jgi:hypothetical protein
MKTETNVSPYEATVSKLAKQMKQDDQAVRAFIDVMSLLYQKLEGHKFDFEGITINPETFDGLTQEAVRFTFVE